VLVAHRSLSSRAASHRGNINDCRSQWEKARRNNESYAACVALGRRGKSLLYVASRTVLCWRPAASRWARDSHASTSVVGVCSSHWATSPGRIRMQRGLIRRMRSCPFSIWTSRKRRLTPNQAARSASESGRSGKFCHPPVADTNGNESFFITRDISNRGLHWAVRFAGGEI
jgi:hypothetical protein